MSHVRSRDTKLELRVRKLLHRVGYRFRLHRRDLPGTPDLYLPKYKLAVFVHGCFWHGHAGCKRAKLPQTRHEFWADKIETNRRRDAAAVCALEKLGVTTVILWQCALKSDNDIIDLVDEATGRNRTTYGTTITAK